MPLSSQLQEFQKTIAAGNIASAQRQLKFAPHIATEHAIDHKGHFVTALDLAMDAGHPSLVNDVLSHGARMDLPVGEPPSYNWYGETAMTRALSPAFQKIPDAHLILECMARHHGERNAQHAAQLAQRPVMQKLRDATSSAWNKIVERTKDLIAGQHAELVTMVVPASAMMAATGMVSQNLMHPHTGLAAFAAIAAGAVAGNIASAKLREQKYQFVVGETLAAQQAFAVERFDEEAHTQRVIQASQEAVRGLLDKDDPQQAALLDSMQEQEENQYRP